MLFTNSIVATCKQRMDTPNPDITYPRLRALDFQPIVYEGMRYLHLRDPLAITGKTLLVPEPLIPMLTFMDGTHDARDLRTMMARQVGLNVGRTQVHQLIGTLDEACYLENERYRQARQAGLDAFRKMDFRPAANAGRAYPESREELKAELDGYFTDIPTRDIPSSEQTTAVRGILSPHIDYERGGFVYARVWAEAALSARKVQQVILLGTDHFSENFSFSLTHLDYSTPLGQLPTDQALVDACARILGERRAFEGELHHRSEHSIELAVVWLQYILGDRPVRLLPVLCGPLTDYEDRSGSLENNQTLNELIRILARAAAERPTWVIAAGDLSHIGPAFGGFPITPAELNKVQAGDQRVIQYILNGDAPGFYAHIRRTEDETNICGVSPIYLAMRILGRTAGTSHAYAACPADTENTSFVTVSGITWA